MPSSGRRIGSQNVALADMIRPQARPVGRPLRDGKNRSDMGTRGAEKKRFETEYERIRRRTI